MVHFNNDGKDGVVSISGIPKISTFSKSKLSSIYTMERRTFDYSETEVLTDYPVQTIRVVKVPHMSSFTSNSSNVRNIRTNVGVAGEE